MTRWGEQGKINNAADAIEEAVAWHSVGIVFSVPSPESGIGTGTALEFNKRNVIVTAKHVVQSFDPSHLCFFDRFEGSLLRESCLDEHKGNEALRERFQLPIRAIHQGESTDDLAVIELEKGADSDSNIRFHRVELPKEPVRENTALVLIGYPFQFTRAIDRAGNRMVRAYIHWGHVKEDSKPLRGFNPDRHFLIEFNEPANSEREPHGVSGAGVWSQTPRGEKNLWYPQPCLRGICIGYYRKSRLLQVTRVDRVIDFLQQCTKTEARLHAVRP